MAVFHKTAVFGSDTKDLLKGGGEIVIDFTSMLAHYCFNTNGSHECIEDIDPRRRSSCRYHKHNSTPVCAETSN